MLHVAGIPGDPIGDPGLSTFVVQCVREGRGVDVSGEPASGRISGNSSRKIASTQASQIKGGSPPIRPRTRRLTSGVRGRLTALNEPRQHDGADAYE